MYMTSRDRYKTKGFMQLQLHSFLSMDNSLHASKRRGRPLGSKNKRKEPEPPAPPAPSAGVQQYGVPSLLKVLEVAAGADVINAVSDFANRFKVNVSVISTYGLVHDLFVYRPISPLQVSYFHRFAAVYELLSLNGNFHGSLLSAARPSLVSAGHHIYFADGEGNAVGGIVRALMAKTRVFLVVAILRGNDCINLPLTSASAQANRPALRARQPEDCSSARGPMSSYGVPSPTPP